MSTDGLTIFVKAMDSFSEIAQRAAAQMIQFGSTAAQIMDYQKIRNGELIAPAGRDLVGEGLQA